MSTPRENRQLGAQLETIRSRLMADPSREELESLQLQVDVLQKWDRLMVGNLMRREEHHDHMDDHVHISEP